MGFKTDSDEDEEDTKALQLGFEIDFQAMERNLSEAQSSE